MTDDNKQQMRAFLFQLAQLLIVHDDFTILPYVPQGEQEPELDEMHPIVLYRRQFNTLQFVRLLPADGVNLQQIEHMMAAETQNLGSVRQQNAVQNVYSLTCFIFSQWRSDENMKAIAEATRYEGITKNRGAAGVAIDLARGTVGPLPKGAVAKDIQFDPIHELVSRYPDVQVPEEMLNRSRADWERYLLDLSERRQERMQKTLQPGKQTVVTIALLVINILIYFWVQSDPNTILFNYMLINEAIRAGEWWRLITPVFLHYELSHIAFNMMSLYYFGRLAERIFGAGRFVIIYLLAGVSGSTMAFALSSNPSLGASGAIFGLFGALLAFGRYDRKTFAMTIGASVYGLLVVNLILGFVTPRVGYWAHIGGLIGGFLISMAIGVPGHKRKQPWLWGLAYAAFVVVTYSLGME